MDTLGNVAVKLKNASRAGKASVSLPYAGLTEAALRALSRAGFVGNVSVSEEGGRRFVEVALKYENKTPAFSEARRISKPSRRLYRGAKEIRRVRRGYGTLILTTSQGVLTDAEARKKKVGGEPLFEVW